MRDDYGRRFLAAAIVLTLGACGGGGGGGGGVTTPSNPSVPLGPQVSTTTVTITATGVTPNNILVPVGSRVTFVNNSGATHDMSSDPHPSHTTCPPLNEVGVLGSGQTRQTGVLDARGTCGFHDHNRPDDTSLRGQIVIQ